MFALSPLVGSPLTTSAKFAVVAFSPLTGRVCDALSSSHFAIAAKRAGVDATGGDGRRATSLPWSSIDGMDPSEPQVEWKPAGQLWGMPARSSRGRDPGAAWNRVAGRGDRAGGRAADSVCDAQSRRPARRAGGLGAVLGSKRIKAIAVRGSQRVPRPIPRRTVALAKHYSRLSFGPATEKYRELGTVTNLLVFNRFDALPTRNFQGNNFDGASRLSVAELDPARRIARASCASCTIGCEHIYAVGGELLQACGSNTSRSMRWARCAGWMTRRPSLAAARACDDAGIDTITTGATIAFLMQCGEEGLIPRRGCRRAVASLW